MGKDSPSIRDGALWPRSHAVETGGVPIGTPTDSPRSDSSSATTPRGDRSYDRCWHDGANSHVRLNVASAHYFDHNDDNYDDLRPDHCQHVDVEHVLDFQHNPTDPIDRANDHWSDCHHQHIDDGGRNHDNHHRSSDDNRLSDNNHHDRNHHHHDNGEHDAKAIRRMSAFRRRAHSRPGTPGTPGTRACRRHSARSEHGAAIVEAVLVTPLFLMLVLGIIELGPFFMNWNAIHSASREGARVASVAGTDPKADKQVLDDIAKRRRLSLARLNYVIVFKATTPNDSPPAACVTAAASALSGVGNLCNVYYPADFARPVSDFGTGTVTAADANWSALDRVDWSDGPPDLIGVHLSTRHDTLTGFIPSATLRHTTVFALETRTESG